MKAKKVLIGALFALVSLGAQAQTVGATAGQNQTATGTSTATVAPNTGNGNMVAMNSYGADSVKTVGNAPALGFGVSFSSDNCASTAGVSGGWLGGSLGVAAAFDKESCVDLRTYERLQQGAASETDPDMKRNLKDASYEVLAEISPAIRGILSRRGVIHGQAAVAFDQSGTQGMQPANYRVEEAAK